MTGERLVSDLRAVSHGARLVKVPGIGKKTAERLLLAADMVGLRHHQQNILAQPKSEVMVQFPVEMDDGRHRLFKGYRVQHSNALGPYLGGVRFAPRLSLDTVKGHALLSTLRASLVRIPFGGAFGGVKVNAGELSRNELMRPVRLSRAGVSQGAWVSLQGCF